MSMTSLSDLENLNIDVEVAPPAEYIDSNNTIIPEGMYDLAITGWEASTNRETKQPDGKAFILNVRVVGGDQDGRTAKNLRVWTATYQRNGVTVSGLGDLIRAIDDSAEWKTLADAATILQRATDQGQTFRAKLKWEAFDLDWYRDQGGDALTPKSPEQKDLRKRASVLGMSNFRQAPDGTFLPEATGPSGNTLEARLSLDRYVPSGKRR
jgi:hypothetical protein